MTELDEGNIQDDANVVVEADESADEAVVETEEEDGEEAEDEADEAEGDEGGEQPAPKKARGAERIRNLSHRLRETEERHARELSELRARLDQPQNQISPAEAARLREEKLSLLDPAERRDFLRDEEIKLLRESQVATQMHIIDATDKAAYDAKATLNPVYAKHKDAVDKALAALRSKGNNASREELLKWVIGHEALNAKPSKAKQQAKQAATARVDAAKGKSTSARSDTASYSGKGNSVEERLRGVLI